MHGRRKEPTSAEADAAKQKERAIKLTKFVAARDIIVKKHENEMYDVEGLVITHKLLCSNPDIYTFWNYRRKTIFKLMQLSEQQDAAGDNNLKSLTDDQKLFKQELELAELCIREQPKSYSAWHQRSWVLKNMQNPDFKTELRICDEALSLDERNFHCWDHRRMVCKLAGIKPEDELNFAIKKVNDNFSNYSAWHYKSSLLPLLYPDSEGVLPISANKLIEELHLATNAFYTDPEDESAWMYTNWLFSRGSQFSNSSRPQEILLGNIDDVENANVCKSHLVIVLQNLANLLHDQVKCFVDGNMVHDCQWTPVGENIDYVQSRSWQCLLPKVTNENVRITIGSYDDQPIAIEIAGRGKVVQIEKLKELTYREIGFGCPVPAALAVAMNKMLENSLELVKEEPTNKWPPLISTLTMMRLDPMKYYATILENFDLLRSLDGKREAYYKDSASKFKVFKAIYDSVQEDKNFLDLSGLGINYIPNCTILSAIEELNISGNGFENINFLKQFGCLKKLNIGETDGICHVLKNLSNESEKPFRFMDVSMI